MSTIWDTDMFKNAWNSLTDEQKKDYQRTGELVYNTIDFETGQAIDGSAIELQELLMAIKNGIVTLDSLTQDEKELLEKYYTDFKVLF
jgi:hypothetical protein